MARARKARLRDKMTAFVIKDIVTYMIFLLIVSKLAYSEKDPNMFFYRKDLVNMFGGGTYTDGPSLKDVSRILLLLMFNKRSSRIFSSTNKYLVADSGGLPNFHCLIINNFLRQ